MQKKIIRIIYLIFIIFLFASNINASKLSLNSNKYIIYNMNDNKVLLEKDSHDETNIASLTKIMSVIIAIENIDDYDEKVKITNNMLKDIEWDVAVAGFKVGDSVTYDDLLYGAIVSSGADAVNALAISVSGNLDDFVKLMNEKVKELNLKNTHFTNVTGLYDKDHYSSAYDMAQILIYSLKNDKFKKVFGTEYYTSTNNINMKSTIVKYNASNDNIGFITGAKTGYIAKAGYCLATTATLNKVDYLLVTLNAFSNTSNPHIKDAVNTYKYYDNNYSYKDIVNKKDVIVTLKTKYAKEKTIDIYSNEELTSFLKNDFDKNDIKYDYKGINEVTYFTKVGTNLGKVNIIYNDEILNTFDLIYNTTLTLSIWLLLWEYKFYIFAFAILLFLLIKIKKSKKRKKKNKKLKV